MKIKEIFKVKKKEKDPVSESYSILLDNLYKSLKLMSEIKLPYFHIEGIGGIYMAETYAERTKVNLASKDDTNLKELEKKLKDIYSKDSSKQLKSLNAKVDALIEEVKKQKVQESLNNRTNYYDEENENEEDEVIDENIDSENVKSKRDGEEIKENINVDEEGEVKRTITDEEEVVNLPPNPNITKEEAVDIVKNGKRITNIQNDWAKFNAIKRQLKAKYPDKDEKTINKMTMYEMKRKNNSTEDNNSNESIKNSEGNYEGEDL